MDTESNAGTLYAILEVEPTENWEVIRESFRRLVKESFEIQEEIEKKERFELLTHAWQILCNEEKRAQYDASLDAK